MQPLEDRGDALNVRASEELAVFSERHSRENGERRILLRREDRRLKLVGIAHRLNDDKIGTGLCAETDFLGKGVVRGIELEISGWLEKAPRRPDVERHEPLAASGLNRLPRKGNACGNDIRERRVGVVFRRVRPERVRVHDVGACGEIRRMDGPDVIWTREVPELRRLAGLKPALLKLRTHSTVEKDEPPFSKDSAGHCKTSVLTPIIALTDLDGTMRRESVSDTPTLRGASRSSKSRRCASSGQSPYPGE